MQQRDQELLRKLSHLGATKLAIRQGMDWRTILRDDLPLPQPQAQTLASINRGIDSVLSEMQDREIRR